MALEEVGRAVEEERGNGVLSIGVVGRRVDTGGDEGGGVDNEVSVESFNVLEHLPSTCESSRIDSLGPSADETPVQPSLSTMESDPGFESDSDCCIMSVGTGSFGRTGSGRCCGGSVLCRKLALTGKQNDE